MITQIIKKVTSSYVRKRLMKLKDNKLIYGFCMNRFSPFVTIHLNKGNKSKEFIVETRRDLANLIALIKNGVIK